MLDPRSRILLKALVERYIADGEPVGSRTLSKQSGLELSPATIRNVMADLEELGFIASPHTSAGRVPTPRGYRFFVDTLLVTQPLQAMVKAAQEMGLSADQGKRLALGTFAGATALAQASSEPPAVLRERVTSKGGTTYAALTHLDAAGVKEAFVAAMRAAEKRAGELGDEFGGAVSVHQRYVAVGVPGEPCGPSSASTR